jgi:hypothetical protein
MSNFEFGRANISKLNIKKQFTTEIHHFSFDKAEYQRAKTLKYYLSSAGVGSTYRVSLLYPLFPIYWL